MMKNGLNNDPNKILILFHFKSIEKLFLAFKIDRIVLSIIHKTIVYILLCNYSIDIFCDTRVLNILYIKWDFECWWSHKTISRDGSGRIVILEKYWKYVYGRTDHRVKTGIFQWNWCISPIKFVMTQIWSTFNSWITAAILC